jgi:hypothetical protein
MNNLFNLPQPGQIKQLYNSLTVIHKGKDKIHMTLEPLQSMVQIALLSVSPIGTKIAIYENILYLQAPSLVQPISRWYNSDRKDDLYFLFQVIKRFIKWYGPKGAKSPIINEQYHLLVCMAKKGLDNLIQTYQTTDSMAIVQVIQMYQDILINKTGIYEASDKETVDSSDSGYDDKNSVISIDSKKEKTNLDEIFENIILIYDENLINIIHNCLLMIQNESNEDALANYIIGLNLLMSKTNDNIKFWIKNNLLA